MIYSNDTTRHHLDQRSKEQPELTSQSMPSRLNLSPHGSKHVSILLALYNGERCLPDQLHSFKCQTHQDWSLIVSDDGSDDNGPDLIRCFARADTTRDVRLISGPQQGFAMNFLELLNALDSTVPFAAFSDQDDCWLAEKLERGLEALLDVPKGVPALYCGRTWVCSSTLRKMRPSPLFRKAPHFRNAIVQSIGGGNTMLMNNAALELVKQASRDTW